MIPQILFVMDVEVNPVSVPSAGISNIQPCGDEKSGVGAWKGAGGRWTGSLFDSRLATHA